MPGSSRKKKYDYALLAALSLLLLTVLLSVPVLLAGDEYNGSRRWLSLGPFSSQSSEFAKVVFLLMEMGLVLSVSSLVK